MGFGADTYEETKKRIEAEFKGTDKDLIQGICLVLRTDANNHKKLVVSDGKFEGMSVMSMAASTGCIFSKMGQPLGGLLLKLL